MTLTTPTTTVCKKVWVPTCEQKEICCTRYRRECRTRDQHTIFTGGSETHWLRIINHEKRGEAEADNHENLEHGEAKLHAATSPALAAMDGRQCDDEGNGEDLLEPSTRLDLEDRGRVGCKRHRGQRGRPRETDRHRRPASNEAHGRVVDVRKEVVLAAGARKRGTQLSVGHGAADCDQPTRRPQQQDDEADAVGARDEWRMVHYLPSLTMSFTQLLRRSCSSSLTRARVSKFAPK